MGNRKKNRQKAFLTFFLLFLMTLAVLGAAIFLNRKSDQISPEELLVSYMDCIGKQEYDAMYDMLDAEASGNISREDFVKRNSAIYEGIEVSELMVEVIGYDKEASTVSYTTTMQTLAGEISFENTALFL